MTSQSCSGCTACASVCNKQAIHFIMDEEGFLVPKVDYGKCIECGLCVKTCPVMTPAVTNMAFETKAFAIQYHDESVRMNSASGSLFPAFANYFINHLDGYVCGCIMDENLEVRHVVSNRWNDVSSMQDSKYVQSNMCECIQEVITYLKAGKYVLFSGTSCQVKGLQSALESKKIDRSKLLTIDFFCHGVPSPAIWKDYVECYAKKKGMKVSGFKFRNKTYGWGKSNSSRGANFLSTWLYNGKYYEDSSLLARIWPRIFFSNLCLRRYCHSCPYTKVDKPSDLTMGDFWGIEEFYPKFNDNKGCSLAVIRSRKAQNIMNKLDKTEIIEVSIDEVIKRQGNAFHPSKPNPLRNNFWDDYKKNGFYSILPKYFHYTKLGRLKSKIRFLIFKLHIGRYVY